jgi:type IV secretion system protein VirB6
MIACPTLPIDAEASMTGALTSLDCQVNGAVASGYAHLFGAGGVLGLALSAGLSIYVAIVALGLLTGHTRLTLGALGPKVLTLGFVLTFATAWPAYQVVVYGLLTSGPDQVASAFLGARSGATLAFAARLDGLFDGVLEIGRALAMTPKAPNLALASSLVWASAVILLLATLGLLVIARIVLAVLLALGPVFLLFGLFDGTRGLFEGWLRTSVAFAVAPTLVVLGGSGLIAVIGPLIAGVADDPVAAVTSLRPVVTLFLACAIYAGLVVALGTTAAALTRGWRLRLASRGSARSHDAVHEARTETRSAAAAPGRSASVTEDRVAGVAAALLRDVARPDPSRPRVIVETLATTAPERRANGRRAQSLGQSFRPAHGRRTLSGSVGS